MLGAPKFGVHGECALLQINFWQCFRKADPEGFLPVHQGQVLRGLLERPASVRVPAEHSTGVPVDW